ncbi:MAG TPA: helix-turn-helix domain-containing protein [Devosia sp.]|nr:helix-turn-helix domain-containing protein [Devosia sp.]
MSLPGPSPAVTRAWVYLIKAQRRALRLVEADIKAAGFPPLAWYDVLLELKHAGGTLRPQELEARLLLAQHNVSRLVDRLAEAELVQRRPYEGDGRGQIIAITEGGLNLQRRMWPVYGAAIQKYVGARLGTDATAEALCTLLEPIVADG